MTTVANVKQSEASHFYLKDGTPFYEVPYKDPTKGMRKATLADARKVNALPSVTTILRILDKPALTRWLIEQAVLAVLTTPRLDGEVLDVFIERVLLVDKEQDKERDAAAELGTKIHAAMELALKGMEFDDTLAPYVLTVMAKIRPMGAFINSELIITGDGYAGRTDAILFNDATKTLIVLDFKSTKKLPKASYDEHRLQLAAYGNALPNVMGEHIETANVYISTTEPGMVAVCMNNAESVKRDYAAFKHALALWQHLNNYVA